MDLPKQMEAYFDTLADTWDNNPAGFDKREEIIRMAAFPTRAVVADMGCGKGVMFPHLLKLNPVQIIGIDISGKMLSAARALFSDPRIELIQGDVLALPLPLLDAALLFNAYPHFLDRTGLARKLAAHMEPGALFVIAHGRGRAELNAHHQDQAMAKLSLPIEDPPAAALHFAPWFAVKQAEDTDALYFLKMERTQEPVNP